MIRNDLAEPLAIRHFTIFVPDRSGAGGNGGGYLASSCCRIGSSVR